MKFKPNNHVFKLVWFPKVKKSTPIPTPLIPPSSYHSFLSIYAFDVCSVTPFLKYLYGLDIGSTCVGVAVQTPSHKDPKPFTSMRRTRIFHHFSDELLIYMTRYPCLGMTFGYPTFHRQKSPHVESFTKDMDDVDAFTNLIYTEVREDGSTKDAKRRIALMIVRGIKLTALIKKPYASKDWIDMFAAVRIIENLYDSGFRRNGGPFSWYTCEKYDLPRASAED